MVEVRKNNSKFTLYDRTTTFGNDIIYFVKKIKETTITRSLISQLVRAGTSVGANYCEADNAGSKKEFTHRITICKKEARETMYWLRIIPNVSPELTQEAQTLWQEAKELNLIFNAIVNSSKSKGPSTF